MSKVANKAVAFINRNTLPTIVSEELDLDACYKDDEIVVKIHAAGLNPVDFALQFFAYPWLVNKQPKAYGRDYSGEIVRAGKNVKNFEVGERITGMFNHFFGKQGSLSNYLVFSPDKHPATVKMPAFNDAKYDDYVLNAAWPLVFSTAHQVLMGGSRPKLGPKSNILVIGASTAVSNSFVQIAKNHLEVGNVVGICSAKSFEHNQALGFDHLVAYDEGNTVSQVKELIKNELNNEKFDLIFDSVGSSDFFGSIDDVLKHKSENSYYLTIVGDHKMDYNNLNFMNAMPGWESLKRLGPFRRYNFQSILCKEDSDSVKLASQLIAEKKFKPAIDSVYDFDQYSEALKKLKSNKTKGKVVVKVT
ncbi:LANO_0E09494g1_1 [Lachancea nothofagi CBS 11611]|uniref:LANO_0E09494g1_1 n=1 Tax=Lachancea nothofagi CBS 11611 TaxID=1266666 RepID=A0A1G4JVV9_9SACH|nr:LANO_0E09494g1_1 [Lachancea nothofagi CBS 11611]